MNPDTHQRKRIFRFTAAVPAPIAIIVLFYIAERADLERRAGEVLQSMQSGNLELRIERALAEARVAHVAIESRQTTGKWLLIP